MEQKLILWLEDDADKLMGLVRPLEKDGHKIIVTYNEVEALEKIEKYNFDLILLDIIIPTGVKDDKGDIPFVGMELLKIIKEKQINTPILVLTVVRHKDMIDEMYNLGATKVLEKGACLPTKLKEEIYEILELIP